MRTADEITFSAPGALRICRSLREALNAAPLSGEVHSVFAHAVNIETARGLVSLLSKGRAPLPHSIVLDTQIPFPALGWERGLPLTLNRQGLFAQSGRVLALLEHAVATELSVHRRLQQSSIRPSAKPVLAWLAENGDENGLSPLVTGQKGNPYTALISSRLPALFEAVAENDVPRTAEAASRIAGCGMGLTPSSDDLLCGFMTTLHAYCAAGFGKISPDALLCMTRSMAQSAAEKTTRISAAFLLQSGNGFASDDVLTLFERLFSGADVREAVATVGSFGSTSGADMLTGIALAIILQNGGMQLGKTGSQEECLL